MGLKIGELLPKKEITLADLKGKKIGIDAHLVLYQFLTSIRQPDGAPLTDSEGRVTSHLQGLFSRSLRLMQEGLKICYVFDGEPPELKYKEVEKRAEKKREALEKYKKALKRKDVEEMKKYAARTSRLTPEMIEESKTLIEALGIPLIQAPSEAEAQAAYMAKKEKIFGVGSQDADSLMFGAPVLVRNLTVSNRRKLGGRQAYSHITPELVELKQVLKEFGINQDQLIALGLLIGTDYNPDGIRGIGPSTGLKLLKEYKNDFDSLFKKVEWDKYFDFSWKEVFDTIKNIPVTDDYPLTWGVVDESRVLKLLCDIHNFSEERVSSSLSKLGSVKEKRQKGLGEFI